MKTFHAHTDSPVIRLASLAAPLSMAVIVLAACQKSERPLTTEERLKAVQTKQETTPDFYVPRKSIDYMADLKTLRDSPRQEREKTEPAAPATAPEPRQAAPTPTPVPVQPQPTVAQRPVEQAPTPAPAPVSTPTAPAQTAAAPAPAPAARPAPAAGDSTVTVVNRDQPNFPREAIRQGIESGTVRARVTINAAGDVTGVSIVQARPPRIFDREVQSSLSRWKFNPGADNRSFETEISFQR